MKTTHLARLAVASLALTRPISWACSSDDNKGGTGGTGGATGGRGGSGGTTGGSAAGSGGTTGGSSAGSGGSTGGSAAGSGGSTGGSSAGSGGSTGGSGTGGSTGGSGTGDGGGAVAACGLGKTAPAMAIIDNFDGMKVTLEWRTADAANPAGAVVTPMGNLKVMVTGADTLAVGALAMWAAMNRPCMDGSQYTGIQFDVTGTVSNLLFRVGTPATLPTADGGTCTDAAACGYAHYQKDVTSSLAAGGQVKVAFADLRPPWGSPAAFDKSALISVVFLTTDKDTTKSFTIDNISFY
jgi:hypothetical protein